MLDDTTFEKVIEQLKRGEENGANEVYHRFAQRLFGLARSRLPGVLRDKVDPEDVVQSAFRSFFSLAQHADEGRRFDVRNWDGLWAVLVLIAIRKCRKQWRLFTAGGRDFKREHIMAAADREGSGWEAVDREPLPEEAVALGDLVEQLLSRLVPRDRLILEQRLQGSSIEEVVSQTGRSERSVYRVLSEARRNLRDLLEAVAVQEH